MRNGGARGGEIRSGKARGVRDSGRFCGGDSWVDIMDAERRLYEEKYGEKN